MVKLTSRETLTKVFDGVDPYTLSLSNDAQTVSTAADGTGGSYADAVTEATVYKGTTVDTSAWTITAQASTGVTGTLTGAVYRVTTLRDDQGTVTLKATNKVDPNKTLTKVFTISKSKRGESNISYVISVNRRVLKKYKDRLIEGPNGSPTIDRGITFDFNDLNIKATKKTGSTEEPFSGYIEITEEVVSTTGSLATVKYFSNAPESMKTYTFTKSDLMRIKVALYRTSDKSELLDTEYVDVLMDGQPAITIVNTNPAVVLPSDYKGVVSDYSSANGQLFVYEGGTDVTSLCTFSLLEQDSLFRVTPEGEFSLTTMSSILDVYSGSIVVGYKDMNFTSSVTVTKGKAGKDGSSAKLLYLTSDSLLFNLDFNGEPKSGPITIQALFQNIEGDANFEVIGVTSAGKEEPILVSPTSNEIVLPASLGKKYIRIRVTASLGNLSDTITLITVKDAVPPITHYLTNENVTLPASASGVVMSSYLSSASGSFKVYEGTMDVTSLATFSVRPTSGATVSIDSAGTYTLTALGNTTDSVAVTLVATYKGQAYESVLNISKSKAGVAGASAAYFGLTTTSMTLPLDKDGNPKLQSVVITPVFQNLTATVSYTVNGVKEDGSETVIAVTPSNNIITLSGSLGQQYTVVKIRATAGGLSDTLTLTTVKDGTPTVVGTLSNETVSLPASVTGVVDTSTYAAATGTFTVYEGGENVTPLATFQATSGPGLTGSITSAGVYKVTALSSSVDSSTLTLKATYKDKTITKVFTVSKSKTGATGDKGDDGKSPILLIIRSSNGNMFKNNNISSTLTATLWQDDKEIDIEGTAFAYIWSKTDSEGNPDGAWDKAHSTSQKSITITNQDVYRRSTFTCYVTPIL